MCLVFGEKRVERDLDGRVRCQIQRFWTCFCESGGGGKYCPAGWPSLLSCANFSDSMLDKELDRQAVPLSL